LQNSRATILVAKEYKLEACKTVEQPSWLLKDTSWKLAFQMNKYYSCRKGEEWKI